MENRSKMYIKKYMEKEVKCIYKSIWKKIENRSKMAD